VRSRSGAERTIGISPRPFRPSGWTADEHFLVTALSRGDSVSAGLWRADETSRQAGPACVLIDEAGVYMWQARISPNGRWMSFVYESTGVAVSTGPSALPPQGLALVPASGATSRKNWTLLAKEFSWIDKPRWSSDGKTLYF